VSDDEERLAALPGLITNEQGLMLARYAGQVYKHNAIIEIGSYKGKSTCYLAYGAGPFGPKVYAVDPWGLDGNVDGKHHYADPSAKAGFDAAVAALQYQARITAIQGFSANVAKSWARPVGLLYIDGDHSEEAVRADYTSWRKHLVEGAYLIFDDLDTPKNPGVRTVVDEVLASRGFQWFQQEGNCGVFRLR
jgi:cephalosporin hydroxylase